VPNQKTGKKRGFAVVEMKTDTEEIAAIHGLRGTEWMGYSLKVNRTKTIADVGEEKNFAKLAIKLWNTLES
jgi:RNA recognition motif-containing protein